MSAHVTCPRCRGENRHPTFGYSRAWASHPGGEKFPIRCGLCSGSGSVPDTIAAKEERRGLLEQTEGREAAAGA